MSGLVLVPAQRWFSVKWWEPTSHADISERIALSIQALREQGFIARFNQGQAVQRGEHESYTQTACRVEVYGTSEHFQRARLVMRGFWAAIESRGCTPDYQAGFSIGVKVLNAVGQTKPGKLPALRNCKRLTS